METVPFNLLTFPLWWYSTGLSLTWEWVAISFRFTLKKSALKIFLRHFGDTLYGYQSRADRIISFCLRVVLLVYKIFAILVKLVFLGLVLLLYLAAIPVLLALIIFYFSK